MHRVACEIDTRSDDEFIRGVLVRLCLHTNGLSTALLAQPHSRLSHWDVMTITYFFNEWHFEWWSNALDAWTLLGPRSYLRRCTLEYRLVLLLPLNVASHACCLSCWLGHSIDVCLWLFITCLTRHDIKFIGLCFCVNSFLLCNSIEILLKWSSCYNFDDLALIWLAFWWWSSTKALMRTTLWAVVLLFGSKIDSLIWCAWVWSLK